MDELNQDISENPQLSPTLSDSFLDELFPTLGENVPSTNPVAVLLNSLGTCEDRGAKSTSLFNLFNLSPPRLHEIHAIATANLISQTQEAIMQEYNITEFDLEQTETVNNDVNSDEPYTLTELSAVPQNSCTTLDSDKTPLIQTSCIQKEIHSQELSNFNSQKHTKESSNDLSDSNIADLRKTLANALPLCNTVESVREVDLAIRHIPISTENEHFNINSKSDNLNINSESCVTLDSFQRTNSAINKPILKVPSSFNISQKKCDVIRQDILKPLTLNTDGLDYPTSTHTSCHLPQTASNLHVLREKSNDQRNLDIAVADDIDTSDGLTNGNSSEQKVEEVNIEISTTISLDESDTGRVMFVCHLCHKVFNTVENLNAHHQNHQKYICPEANCARTFVSRGHLQYHMQTHKGSKPHQCDICGKTFMKSQHLEAHVRTHTLEKPFTCTECGKGFTTEGNMKNHLRLHSGEKPYACDVENCKKRFSELSSLKKHKVTHSGEKPYKCEICNKGFTQASSRSYHMKKHTVS